MTCIISYTDVQNRTMYIGADTCVSTDSYYWKNCGKKVFQRDNLLFGLAGCARVNQIIQYCLDIPEYDKDICFERYLIEDLFPAIKELLDKYEVDEDMLEGFRFLVGYEGKFYEVDRWFCLIKDDRKPFQCIGQSSDFSYGCLEILSENEDMNIPSKIEKALHVGTVYVNGVKGPYDIISLTY